MSCRLQWLPAVAFIIAGNQVAFAQGTAFTYQGKLVDGGVPAQLTYDLQFRVFDAATGPSQQGPTLCVDNYNFAGSGGVFTVTLDFGAVFTGAARWLEIGVRPAGAPNNCAIGSYTTLSPRQAITATPYALNALKPDGHSLDAADGTPADALYVDNEGRVGIGTLAPTRRVLVDYDVDGVADLGVRNPNPGAGAQALVNVTADACSGALGANSSNYSSTTFRDRITLVANSDASGLNIGASNSTGDIRFYSGGFASANQRMLIDSSGNVGIGTTAPANRLSLAGSADIMGTVGIWTTAPTRDLEISRSINGGVHAGVRNPNTGNNAFALLAVNAEAGQGSLAAYSNSFPSPWGGRVALTSSTNTGLLLGANATTGHISLQAGGLSANEERMRIGAEGVRLRNTASNNLLFNGAFDDAYIDFVKPTGTTPSARIAFCGFTDPGTNQASMDFFTRLSTNMSIIRYMSLTADGHLQMFHPNGSRHIDINGNEPVFGSGSLNVFYSPTVSGVRLSGRIPAAGTDRGGGIDLYLGNGTNNIEMRAAFESTQPAAWVALKDNGAERITFAARSASSGLGGLVDVKNNSGVPTIRLMGDTGGGFGELQTSVLAITGGSDLSERFEVCGDDTPQPGMLVCIDPEHPGGLLTSRRAYDRTVAGIISGANGIRTGMMMGQRNSIAEGRFPVALSGRVYCWCDASGGPIEPGDMLTTSDRPGHAMRVTDWNRAHGAVVGKAMGRLAEGRGLVLVLVNLQ